MERIAVHRAGSADGQGAAAVQRPGQVVAALAAGDIVALRRDP